LVSEVPNLAERIAVHLIQHDEHWYPGHINAVPITRIEDNNIKLLWLTMIVLIIGLTMLFNNYIIPTELILRILHDG
jgi:hypothetical protein